MKKLLMLSSLIAIITFSACAQELDASKVPVTVKAAFAKKFPGATPEWGKENSKEYEAEFKMNGKSASANFLTDGSWVETEMEINNAELPQPAAAAVKTKYPDATILKVFKIDNAKGDVTYEAEIKTGSKKKELVLKADGTIVK
jgi:uncharacterized lipoprotein NlpE involved in copper resistance